MATQMTWTLSVTANIQIAAERWLAAHIARLSAACGYENKHRTKSLREAEAEALDSLDERILNWLHKTHSPDFMPGEPVRQARLAINVNGKAVAREAALNSATVYLFEREGGKAELGNRIMSAIKRIEETKHGGVVSRRT